jgi:hypothetical protein
VGHPFGITTQHLRDFVKGGAFLDGLIAEAKRLADEYQFFPWHLVFPGGFAQGRLDVNLGNPPWERVKRQEKEWFAVYSREKLANATNTAARQPLIDQLQIEEPTLHRAFVERVLVSGPFICRFPAIG